MKINQFIFYILFEIFALNFLDKQIFIYEYDYNSYIGISFFKNKNPNIYFLYAGEYGKTYTNTTLLEIDSEKDEVIKKSIFPGIVKISSRLTNDINVFITYQNDIINQKDGKFPEEKHTNSRLILFLRICHLMLILYF